MMSDLSFVLSTIYHTRRRVKICSRWDSAIGRRREINGKRSGGCGTYRPSRIRQIRSMRPQHSPLTRLLCRFHWFLSKQETLSLFRLLPWEDRRIARCLFVKIRFHRGSWSGISLSHHVSNDFSSRAAAFVCHPDYRSAGIMRKSSSSS